MKACAALHRGAAALMLPLACSGIAVHATETRPVATAVLPAALPLRRGADEEGPAVSWLPGLMGAGVIAGLGGWLAWRRVGAQRARARAPEALQRLASQPLTPQCSVHVVRWHGEEFLLASTAQQVTMIGRKPASPDEGERA